MPVTVSQTSPATRSAFRHAALLYAGDSGFLAGTVPFVQEAVAGDEPALVVVSEPKIGLLRRSLGRDADRVCFVDMAEVGRNPARIIPAWQAFLGDRPASGRPVRGIGERVSSRRSPAELVECQRHESLLNLAFAGTYDWWLLCPYDTASLSRKVIEEAHRSHPVVVHEQGGRTEHRRGAGRRGAARCAPGADPVGSTSCPSVPGRSASCATPCERMLAGSAWRAVASMTSCWRSTRWRPTASLPSGLVVRLHMSLDGD